MLTMQVDGEYVAVLTLESPAAACKWRLLRVDVLVGLPDTNLGSEEEEEVEEEEAGGGDDDDADDRSSVTGSVSTTSSHTSSSTGSASRRSRSGSGNTGEATAAIVHPRDADLDYLHALLAGVVVTSPHPLVALHTVLHDFCASLALESLVQQATALSRGRFARALSVMYKPGDAAGAPTASSGSSAGGRLTLSYWHALASAGPDLIAQLQRAGARVHGSAAAASAASAALVQPEAVGCLQVEVELLPAPTSTHDMVAQAFPGESPEQRKARELAAKQSSSASSSSQAATAPPPAGALVGKGTLVWRLWPSPAGGMHAQPAISLLQASVRSQVVRGNACVCMYVMWPHST